MSEKRVRIRRKQRLIAENPYCCLCGGSTASTSEDHIPPRGCFPPGRHPEGIEFPACDDCNQATRPYDDIFGFYAMALDFNPENLEESVFHKKIAGILNNYPGALPIFDLTANQKRSALKRMGMRRLPGQSLSDVGVFTPPPELLIAANIVIRKMTCAIYFRETGRILPRKYRVTGSWQQMQDKQRAHLIKYFDDLLPEYRNLTRGNIRNYGRRLCYKFGYKEKENFLAFVAQIGDGLIINGMTIAPDAQLPSPLRMPVWQVGAPWVGEPQPF